MKFAKRLLAVLLALMTLVSVPVFAKSQTFSDVERNHWAFDYIDALVERNVVKGYADGTFGPGKNVTRAEWAKMLAVTAEIPTYPNYKEVIDFCSEDVKSDNWAAPYLVTVLPFFPFEGTESPYGKVSVKFQPSKAATRLEITKSIVLEKGYSLKKPDYNLVTNFTDYLDIPEEDMAYVAVAVEKGIIKGMDDGSFKPNKKVTRAEAATILYRAYIGEQEEAVDKKPYKMSTLVDAEISKMYQATFDNIGNLYYIDQSDNKVYKMSLRDRKKVEYLDISSLSYEDKKGGVYSSYYPAQVFYDKTNDNLLLSGYFKSKTAPGAKPVSDGKFPYIFNITDAKKVKMYLETKYFVYIQAVVKNDYVIVNDGTSSPRDYTHSLKLNGEGETSLDYGNALWAMYSVSFHQTGNDIYYMDSYRAQTFDNGRGSIMLKKYDYSEDSFKAVTEWINPYAYGFKGDYLYYIDSARDSEYIMYKVNLKTLSFTPLDFSVTDEYVEFSDMLGTKNLSYHFFVVNDYTYIFYDFDRKAFRILEKNDSGAEEEEREYDDDFYSFYDSYMPD